MYRRYLPKISGPFAIFSSGRLDAERDYAAAGDLRQGLAPPPSIPLSFRTNHVLRGCFRGTSGGSRVRGRRPRRIQPQRLQPQAAAAREGMGMRSPTARIRPLMETSPPFCSVRCRRPYKKRIGIPHFHLQVCIHTLNYNRLWLSRVMNLKHKSVFHGSFLHVQLFSAQLISPSGCGNWKQSSAFVDCLIFSCYCQRTSVYLFSFLKSRNICLSEQLNHVPGNKSLVICF